MIQVTRYVTGHFILIFIPGIRVDIDDPLEVSSPIGRNSVSEPNPEQIAMFADMVT